MKRIDFIKRSAVAGFGLAFFNKAVAGTSACAPTPGETEGPFSTHDPSKLISRDITSGRKGIPLTINIAVFNIDDNCSALKDAVIDIWHCDSKGEYSEYGGKDEHGGEMHDSMRMPPPGAPPFADSLRKGDGRGMPPPMHGGSMQAADHKKEHFLRGRQTADKNGEVSFQSIYPGWYSGRAPHIHAHIYSAAGNSLLVTQIAFPEQISKVVYAQVVYAPHGQPDTKNDTDMVFGDSINHEMATLTGNPKDGFVLRHSIYVKG